MTWEGVLAALLIGPVLLACHALALRLLPGEPAALRWSAAGICGVSAAQFAFHVLIALGCFRIGIAMPLVGATAAVVVRAVGVPPRELLAALGRDLAAAGEAVVGVGSPGMRAARALAAGVTAFVGVRALLLPPLGWDSLTYHAVKAALWVQSGGPLALDLPGGWSFYKYYPPGGEILGAWAMLPFHDDTLYLWVDVAVWLLWAPVLLSSLRELSVPARHRGPICLYGMTLPGVYHWIATGYVDITALVLASAGLLFALRALRGVQPGLSPALSLLAFAGAVTVKITALAFPVIALGAILAGTARAPVDRRALRRGCFVGSVLALWVVAPVWLRNAAEQGYPLSPYGFELGGLVLGQQPASLDFYAAWNARDGSLALELASLATLLGLRGYPNALHFGPLAIPIVVLAVAGALRRGREWPATVGLLVALAAAQLAFYFSPGFTFVRLFWAGTNARFVALSFTACVLLASLWLRGGRFARGVDAALLAASALSVTAALASFPSRLEGPALVIGVVLIGGGLLVLAAAAKRTRPLRLAAVSLAAAFAALALAAAPLQKLRAELRYAVIGQSLAAHSILPELARLAAHVDVPGETRHVAVSYGPAKLADRGYLYLLLGSQLQNRLHAVPVTRDGSPVEFSGLDPVAAADLDPEAWVARVLSSGVSDVAVLMPAWHEEAWMQARPDQFRFVGGRPGHFGIYRVLRPPE